MTGTDCELVDCEDAGRAVRRWFATMAEVRNARHWAHLLSEDGGRTLIPIPLRGILMRFAIVGVAAGLVASGYGQTAPSAAAATKPAAAKSAPAKPATSAPCADRFSKSDCRSAAAAGGLRLTGEGTAPTQPRTARVACALAETPSQTKESRKAQRRAAQAGQGASLMIDPLKPSRPRRCTSYASGWDRNPAADYTICSELLTFRELGFRRPQEPLLPSDRDPASA